MGSQNYTDISYLIKNLLEDASTDKNYTNITHLVKRAQKNRKTKKLLETSLRGISLVAIFISFTLSLNFYLNKENDKNAIYQSQVLGVAIPATPRRLIIPKINVDADIKVVGVVPSGAMEVPSNIVNVGWFKLGPRPGERGSAVISGHFDGKNGEAAAFTNLHKLEQGDKFYIKDGKGTIFAFVVREKRIYNPGYADEVYSQVDTARLNLITCDGVWDGTKKSYSKRLVVFADIVH